MNEIISLNGEWQFRSKDDSEWKEGKVPGCVQLDLLALGEIDDPFYRLNEAKYHELEEKEWVYRKTFKLDISNKKNIYIVFEGIDTFADIYLNKKHLGRVENMFIPYRFEVDKFLKSGENIIEARFDSPVKTIRSIMENSSVDLEAFMEKARPYVRKAQYSYGWDWGPRIAQTGIWKSVYLEIIDRARILYPYFNTEKIDGRRAFINAGAEVEVFTDEGLTGLLNISFNGKKIIEKEIEIESFNNTKRIHWQGMIENPNLWYPNGIGAQPLYDITLSVKSNQDTVAETEFKGGIRTLHLIQEKDTEGKSFIFEINGIKVFAKGANWIPADSLLPRITSDDYYHYVEKARDANMNMLRIWGGGIYESSAFYKACDEMGIMVWQDFMYSCAEYPDQLDWFQKLAKEEAEHIVKSLRSHSSIVLWCGNNENNWCSQESWRKNEEPPKYFGNYIYKEILPDICSAHDPCTPYWVSSPYGGKDVNSIEEGDRHVWTVWNRWEDDKYYLKETGRFISEFGFQAMPCWKTILSFTTKDDRHLFSPVMLSHQKRIEGNERNMRFIIGNLGFPKDFQSFIYLSQFNQAEAIKTGVEHWRMRKFKTAGTLYWQFNDCWPVAGWSCIDYYKREKALYYYTKKFYCNTLPFLRYEDGKIVFYAVNDSLSDINGNVRISAYNLDGKKTGEKKLQVVIEANGASKIKSFSPSDFGIGFESEISPVDANCTTLPVKKNKVLLNSVIFVEMDVNGDTTHNYLIFDKFRNLELKKICINFSVKNKTIELISNVPAFGVFIEPDKDIVLSDNCLNMEPGVCYRINANKCPNELKVFDLSNMVRKLY